MDLQARHEMALDLLQKSGQLTVAELSEATGVSSMTIRRDLEMLEGEGVLHRVHGGAVAVSSRAYATPYSVRAKRSVKEKEEIGRAAAALLRDGEAVILDVGTTALHVARALRGRRDLTVVTPSLQVANVLVKNRGIRLIVAGGTVVAGEQSMVGDLAGEVFSRLRCDTFVMGVGGIDVDAGCTEFSLEDAAIKRAALSCARRCIVVADSSKIGRVSLAHICALERVDVLVTDSGAAEDDLLRLRSEHLEVVASGRHG